VRQLIMGLEETPVTLEFSRPSAGGAPYRVTLYRDGGVPPLLVRLARAPLLLSCLAFNELLDMAALLLLLPDLQSADDQFDSKHSKGPSTSKHAASLAMPATVYRRLRPIRYIPPTMEVTVSDRRDTLLPTQGPSQEPLRTCCHYSRLGIDSFFYVHALENSGHGIECSRWCEHQLIDTAPPHS